MEFGIVLGVPGDDQRDRKVFRRPQQALGGLMGQGEGAHQPTKGLCAPPNPSHITRRGGGTSPRAAAPPGLGGKFPRGGGAQTHLGFPLWPPPLPLGTLGRLLHPLPPIYSEGEIGQPHPSPGATLSLPNTSSSSVVLGEALPENCKLQHHAVVLPELSLNFSSPLAGSRRRRRPRAVHVLNVEVTSVRH